jgi:pimeloyl-ACP methyl ester carboxylesterase
MRGFVCLTAVLLVGAVLVDGGAVQAADSCTPRAGDVSFRAADGTRLVGHRFGHGTTGVVLAHQSDGTLCQWAPYAKRLAGLGYLVVVFDFRSSGDSQYRAYPANRRWGGDVAAAVKVARSAGATKVVLVGASLGGSAVISAAANVRPRVAGVVSVSGSADLADALAAAKRLRVPALFLAAKGDRDFAPDVARFVATTPAAKQGVVLPGSQHGVQLVASSARARSLIEGFIRAR